MPSHSAHHFRLELEPDPDAIHGVLEQPDGTRHQFWGWLELMAALERATSSQRQSHQEHAG